MRLTFFFTGLLLMNFAACSKNSHEQPLVSENPDLILTARETGFTLAPVSRSEKNFLHTLFKEKENRILRSVTILRDDDRVAAAFWYQDPDVNIHMQRLTARLFEHFSSNMHDLIDESITKEGYVPIDILAFTDPVLSNERFVFAVIRDHLYEFHVDEEKEGWVQGLLLEIATLHES